MTAPNASQMKQLGSATATKIAAKEADRLNELSPSVVRYVPAALAQTSQDFGLTHCSAAARRKPIASVFLWPTSG